MLKRALALRPPRGERGECFGGRVGHRVAPDVSLSAILVVPTDVAQVLCVDVVF